MDTEKGFQPDTSFQNQSYWASCNICRAPQKKQFIVKSVFGLVLLGLLALYSYQSIHALPSNLSSLQLQQHDAISIKVPEHHTLSLTVETSPTAEDAPWAFTAYRENGCRGEATNLNGDKSSIQCQTSNQPYNATSVPVLDKSLKLCFYLKADCAGQAQEITHTTDCQNIPTFVSYRVLKSFTSCQLQLM